MEKWDTSIRQMKKRKRNISDVLCNLNNLMTCQDDM